MSVSKDYVTWKTLVNTVAPLDPSAMAAASARQVMLTKPPGSLGRLEVLSIQLAHKRRGT